MLRPGVAARIGGLEPVDVRQQHHTIRADHLRDTCRKTIVVAIADLRRRNRIVLVDHRDRPERQQCPQRGSGVQVTATPLAVLEREQHLRDRDVVVLEQFLVGMGEPDLPNRGGGLTLLQTQGALRQRQMTPAERDRTRRNQQDFLAALPQPDEVLHQGFEPGTVQTAGIGIHQ